MVRINPKNMRGGPGMSERLLAQDSGLRSRRFSFVTTGFRSDHATNANVGGMWRNVRQSDAPDTWSTSGAEKTYGNPSIQPTVDSTGWRASKLPFPSTLCVSMLFLGMGASPRVQFIVSGLDQFGMPMTETSPVVPLFVQDGTVIGSPFVPFVYITARVFMSRVFSEVHSFTYKTWGTAPAAFQINLGQHFTFNSQLAYSVSSVDGAHLDKLHLEQFYFPANQGIGTGALLAQERGTVTSRFPEIRAHISNFTAGPQNVAVLNGYEDVALYDDETLITPGTYYTKGGIYMGFTPVSEFRTVIGTSSKNQDLLTLNAGAPTPYTDWQSEPLKFRVDHCNYDNATSTAAFQNPQRLHVVPALDASTNFSFYTNPTQTVWGQFVNPRTLLWNVEVFTLAGTRAPAAAVSDRVNS